MKSVVLALVFFAFILGISNIGFGCMYSYCYANYPSYTYPSSYSYMMIYPSYYTSSYPSSYSSYNYMMGYPYSNANTYNMYYTSYMSPYSSMSYMTNYPYTYSYMSYNTYSSCPGGLCLFSGWYGNPIR